jgi:hypothetical protein
MSVIIECFPKGEKGFVAWSGTGVNEDADLWIKNSSKSVEEPAMGIDLFAILLFETEDHLHRRKIAWIVFLWTD